MWRAPLASTTLLSGEALTSAGEAEGVNGGVKGARARRARISSRSEVGGADAGLDTGLAFGAFNVLVISNTPF
jgi:hypothetical protein